jgi:hypothetical protein
MDLCTTHLGTDNVDLINMRDTQILCLTGILDKFPYNEFSSTQVAPYRREKPQHDKETFRWAQGGPQGPGETKAETRSWHCVQLQSQMGQCQSNNAFSKGLLKNASLLQQWIAAGTAKPLQAEPDKDSLCWSFLLKGYCAKAIRHTLRHATGDCQFDHWMPIRRPHFKHDALQCIDGSWNLSSARSFAVVQARPLSTGAL